MKSLRIIVFLLVLSMAAPALASDMSSGGAMMGGSMMGHGKKDSMMDPGTMKEHRRAMGDMMGMMKDMMVIMEGIPGVKVKQKDELKGMIKRMDEIMEMHGDMMKKMDKKMDKKMKHMDNM